MIWVIAHLTIRQLVGRGRTILVGLLSLIPIGLAVLYRVGSSDTVAAEWTSNVLLEGLVVTSLLPLVALVNGTAALGAEIEDGTAVYLLAKPVPRSQIILGKLLGAWLVTSVTVLLSGLSAAVVALGGLGSDRIVLGFAVALVAGSLVYTALFVMLSVQTSRALLAGLAYVFLWEGLVNGLFSGTRLLSVRHYTLGIADGIVDIPPYFFEAKLGVGTSLVLATVVAVGATWQAVRRLGRFEIGETT